MAMLLLAPAFWPNLLWNYHFTSMLELCTGLGFCLMSRGPQSTRSYLALAAIASPSIIILLLGEVPAKSELTIWLLTLVSLWLIATSTRTWAHELLTSPKFSALFAIVITIFCIHALTQHYSLEPTSQNLFPFFYSQPGLNGPLSGIFNQPNLFGLMLALGILVCWHQGHCSHQNIWYALAILPLACLMLTGSKSSWLATCIAMLGHVIITKSFNWKAFALCLGAALTLEAYIQSTLQISSAVSLARIDSPVSYGIRLVMWLSCFELLKDHWLLGIGMGNYQAYAITAQASAIAHWPFLAAFSANTSGVWVHNWLLEWLVCNGVFGFAAFAGLVLWPVLKRLAKISSQHQAEFALPATMLVAITIHGLTSASVMLELLFPVLAALCVAALFPTSNSTKKTNNRYSQMLALILIATSAITAVTWLVQSASIEKAYMLPASSDEYRDIMNQSFQSPLVERQAYEWFMFRLWKTHPPAQVWGKAYPVALKLWQLQQSQLALKYLILITHIRKNTPEERQWIRVYVKAWPHDKTSTFLKNHIEPEHQESQTLQL